jgi:hypothetical protein
MQPPVGSSSPFGDLLIRRIGQVTPLAAAG